MTKLLVVIGAGASFDCVNQTQTEVKQINKPPLVHQLFDIRFNDIINRYTYLANSADEIRTLLKSKSIEEILYDYSKEKSKDLKKTFYYIPIYLQYLFMNRINNYIPPKNASKYESLLRALERTSFSEINIVTLNYDNFIERAFKNIFNVDFINPIVKEDYQQIKNKYNLYKLHGSSNWVRSVKYKDHIRIQELIDVIEPDEEMTFHDEYYNQNAPLSEILPPKFISYPAISAPIKDYAKFNCPIEFKISATNSIIDSNHFLFLGFSARDNHINELFKQTKKVEKFLFVNGSFDYGMDALKNLNNSSSLFQIDKSHIFDGGFSTFVESGLINDFLNDK